MMLLLSRALRVSPSVCWCRVNDKKTRCTAGYVGSVGTALTLVELTSGARSRVNSLTSQLGTRLPFSFWGNASQEDQLGAALQWLQSGIWKFRTLGVPLEGELKGSKIGESEASDKKEKDRRREGEALLRAGEK
jgi:hypothetical protein